MKSLNSTRVFLLLTFTFIILSCSSSQLSHNIIKEKDYEEIYVVYDRSYYDAQFFLEPRQLFGLIKDGYRPIKTQLKYRRIFKQPVDDYFFIGKFKINKDKTIDFVPVTLSNGFKKRESSYKKHTLNNIQSLCVKIEVDLKCDINEPEEYTYADIIDIHGNSVIKLTKQDPAYTEMFLAGLGRSVPYYLVINEEYGKKLMEKGIIVPDVEEVKANLIWKDWYFKEIIYTEHW